jgi:hypothetical protein
VEEERQQVLTVFDEFNLRHCCYRTVFSFWELVSFYHHHSDGLFGEMKLHSSGLALPVTFPNMNGYLRFPCRFDVQ